MEYRKIYKKIAIFDGSYALHRVLHVPAVFDLCNSEGEKSGGVFGFFRTFLAELKKNGGYFPVICWDSKLSKRRIEADPYYKHANERDNNLEVLSKEDLENDYLYQYRRQRSYVIEMCKYLGVPSLLINGWEGDDLMYIMSNLSEESRVFTDDKDMLQLVNKSCDVRRPMADELYNEEKLFEEYNISSVRDFVINKSIIGDGSDNIPSCCKGVGGGTSSNLVKVINECERIDSFDSFKSEEDMRKLCESVGAKFRKAFLNFDKDRFDTNMELINLKLVDGDIEKNGYIIDQIKSEISSSRDSVNFFKAVQLFNKLDIKDVSIDEIVSNVKNRYSCLFIE